MEPTTEGCAAKEAKDANATKAYNWQVSQLPEAPCAATRDRFGYCGNPAATITYGVVCQKQATGSNGTVEVLQPYVDARNATRLDANVTNNCISSRLPTTASRTFPCATRSCEVLKPKTRAIGECFSMEGLTCGPLVQMQTTRCYSDSNAVFIDDPAEVIGTECEDLVGSRLQNCTDTTPCPPGAFWQYKGWESCTATCSGSTDRQYVVTGTQTRIATCKKYNGTELVDALGECTTSAIDSRECSKTCFNPLPRYLKAKGACVSTACDVPGTRTLTYTACTGGSGCVTHDNVTTAGTVSEACPAVPCDPCAGSFCVAANTLSSASSADSTSCECTCKSGFEGQRCHRQAGQSYTVLDAKGKTCASAVTDKDGACCDNGIDGCGFCAGAAIAGLETYRVGLDIAGKCCHGADPTVFLTGSFECCTALALVDECGVCNGSGDTCNKQADGSIDPSNAAAYGATQFGSAIKTELPSTASVEVLAGGSYTAVARRRRLLAATPVSYRVPPGGAPVSAGELAAKFVVAGAKAAASTDLLSAPAVPVPTVVGVPGNGVCEIGETFANSATTGAPDCPEPLPCPAASSLEGGNYLGSPAADCSGNGICNRASGMCACSTGYTGAACDLCNTAMGYVDVPLADGTYACTKLAGDFPPPTPAPSTPGGSPLTPRSVNKKSGLGTGAIIGIAIGAAGGAGLIGGVAYYCVRVKGAKNIGPA
jgi:EGF-like domain